MGGSATRSTCRPREPASEKTTVITEDALLPLFTEPRSGEREDRNEGGDAGIEKKEGLAGGGGEGAAEEGAEEDEYDEEEEEEDEGRAEEMADIEYEEDCSASSLEPPRSGLGGGLPGFAGGERAGGTGTGVGDVHVVSPVDSL